MFFYDKKITNKKEIRRIYKMVDGNELSFPPAV